MILKRWTILPLLTQPNLTMGFGTIEINLAQSDHGGGLRRHLRLLARKLSSGGQLLALARQQVYNISLCSPESGGFLTSDKPQISAGQIAAKFCSLIVNQFIYRFSIFKNISDRLSR